jgi:SAM-dependent methyltransferase
MSRKQLLIALAVLLVVGVAGLGGYFMGRSSDDSTREAKAARAKAKKEERAEEEKAKQEKAKQDKAAKEKAKQEKAAKKEPYTCNVCNKTSKFEDFMGRESAICPHCKIKERHRLLVHYVVNETSITREKLDVLHFAPQIGEKRFYRSLPNLHYVTADYLDVEDVQLDLTALALPDESWDVLFVYHILEHIIEDQKAMQEMYRVLRPGGMALLQVPLEPDRTEIYEDAKIVSAKARKKAFGQWDHVRRYSAAGFQQRLEAAGFEVEAVDYIAKLDPEIVAKHRMSAAFKEPLDERIWIARKPKGAAGSEKGTPAEDAKKGDTKPDAAKPDAAKPDAAKTDAAKTDAAKPDAKGTPMPTGRSDE